MNTLATIQTGVNIGDILFQLITITILLSIPTLIILFFVKRKKRNDRLNRMEEKLDQLLDDKDNKKS